MTVITHEDASTQSPEPDEPEDLDMVAYRIGGRHVGPVEPAGVRRAWMDETDSRFANRCLPMLMANQAGWWMLNTRAFEAVWDGGANKRCTRLTFDAGRGPFQAASHFGYGIVTFHVPLLIRTPPGWNLLVRGPANHPKDGVTALEGLVETDWAVATFTMNWKLTRPGLAVRFEKDEPFCLLVPQRRGELEDFHPRLAPAGMMPDLDGYRTWASSRRDFLRERRRPAAEPAQPAEPTQAAGAAGKAAAAERSGPDDWQRDYMRGTDPAAAVDGRRFDEHQRRLALRPFADPHPLGPVLRCAPGPAVAAACDAPQPAPDAPPDPRESQTSKSTDDRPDRVVPP
ncbi:MAG TPA: DUF6065 family protein [Actinocrinis sp.]